MDKEEIEQFPPTNDLEKILYISRLKGRFNDALIKLERRRLWITLLVLLWGAFLPGLF